MYYHKMVVDLPENKKQVTKWFGFLPRFISKMGFQIGCVLNHGKRKSISFSVMIGKKENLTSYEFLNISRNYMDRKPLWVMGFNFNNVQKRIHE